MYIYLNKYKNISNEKGTIKMNKKIKVFYIIDIVIVVLSAIGLIVIENNKEFGLSALEGTGKFVILGIIFLISLLALIIVSIIYFIKRRKLKK